MSVGSLVADGPLLRPRGARGGCRRDRFVSVPLRAAARAGLPVLRDGHVGGRAGRRAGGHPHRLASSRALPHLLLRDGCRPRPARRCRRLGCPRRHPDRRPAGSRCCAARHGPAIRPGRRRHGARSYLGFTAVFVSYGALFGDLGRRLIEHQHGLDQILGILTIILGLLFAGVFGNLPLANREWRFHRLPAPGLAGAAVLGVLFGLGWTPCVGPTLAAVQGLAIDSATAARGAFLSAVYCLGLGLPFLVVGVAFRRTAGAMVLLRRHARALQLVGGGLLVTLGLLELTGLWEDVLSAMRGVAPTFTPGL